MAVIIDGTAGIANNATDLSYTGTLTGGTGVVNLGSGQVYKDASGNVGIGTSSPGSFAAENDSRLVVGTGSGNTGGISLYSATTGHGDINFADGTSGAATYAGILRYDHGLNAMQFYTNGFNERARIDSSGNLIMANRTVGATGQIQAGTTSNTSSVNGYVVVAGGASDPFPIGIRGESTNQGFVGFFDSTNTEVGRIGKSGSNTTYVTSSDYRLKDTIAPMVGALAKVALLKPCTYTWKVDGSDGQGFIAHELQAVVPDCVHGEKDAVDAEGKPQYQGIDTSFLVATLAAAIQELKAVVDAQATRITALEGAAA